MATSNTYSAAGTKLYIATAAPATMNIAGFTAATWAQIGKIKSYQPASVEAEILTNQYLEDLFESKNKGINRVGNSTLNIDVKDGDAGQTAVRESMNDKNLDYFKVAYPNGREKYIAAYVAGYSETDLQPTGMVSATVTLAQTLIYVVLGVIWLLPLRRFLIWMETGRWG